MSFKDYFSTQAEQYAKYRPTYPEELFDYLDSLSAEHVNAWDCATGSGQSAIALSHYFSKVYATDASEAQIRYAQPYEKIIYQVCTAEKTPFADQMFDLITVATALHWFDQDLFFNEANRVLKPKGIFAAWAYGHTVVSAKIDAVLHQFYSNVLAEHATVALKQTIKEKYSAISMPFEKLNAPAFTCQAQWSLSDYLKYVATWSSVQRILKSTSIDPIQILEKELALVWGDSTQSRLIQWPLLLVVGMKS